MGIQRIISTLSFVYEIIKETVSYELNKNSTR